MNLNRNRVFLLLIEFTLIALLVGGCRGTLKATSTEREQAVKFYGELYPISKALRVTMDEWNRWNTGATQREYQRDLYRKSKYYETSLRELSNRAVALYAPPALRSFKDLTVSAINKGIESFSYAQEYALSPYNENYRLRAEASQLEFNLLLGRAADEYDDGIARYEIKPSEIIR